MDAALLLVSFAVVLAGALLFTNAVEWLGHRLNLGEGAVGSILAAVGTATPETLIAIVALLDANEGSEDVAIGAIVGAPFLLATLAMGLVGLFAYLYRARREQGVRARRPPPDPGARPALLPRLLRARRAARLGPAGGAADPGRHRLPRSPTCFYIRRTLRGGGAVQERGDARPAALRPPRRAPLGPGARRSASCSSWSGSGRWSAAPTSSSNELLTIADSIGVDALVLALILAPLATELPEKVNSFFWVREGKDALALGNISGAMVFQSTIPVGIGLLFTDWALDGNAVLSICLGLAGGLLAYVSLHRGRRFRCPRCSAGSRSTHPSSSSSSAPERLERLESPGERRARPPGL